jgi:hypothetical protein
MIHETKRAVLWGAVAVWALLAPAACEITVGDGAPAWPADVERGIDFAGWTPGGYATPESLASLDQLASTGATHVAIVVTAYVDDLEDSTVELRPDRTPTMESVRVALDHARELGLEVALMPHVDVIGGAYRGLMEPGDPTRWFETYRDVLVAWAAFAHETGCAAFWIGKELESLAVHRLLWTDLIAEVRDVFPGVLVYAANWTDLGSETTLELGRLVDAVGVDAYFPVAEWPDASVTDMVAGWQPWLRELDGLASQTGRPVIVTELGCASRCGAPVSPWDYVTERPLDLDEQARYYEAALIALPTCAAVTGVYVWAWGIAEAGPTDDGHSPRNKPAEDVLRRFWLGQ